MAMTNMERLQQELADVDAAIAAVRVGGQEYRIDNRMVRRADLRWLMENKRQLENDLRAEQDGFLGCVRVPYFDRR